MNDKARQLLLFTGLPLSIGALIYYIFLPDVHFVQIIDSFLPCSIHVSYPSQIIGLRVLRNYLFDFIWAFALSSCLFIFLEIKNRDNSIKVLLGLAFFETIMELSQLSHIFPGTFDICDIIAELVANIIVITLFSGGLCSEKME